MIAFFVLMTKELIKQWWLWLILLVVWAAFHVVG
jgi:hypothetical protein